MARRCPKCGKDIPPSVVRCTHCEALLPSEMMDTGEPGAGGGGAAAQWDAQEALGTWASQKVYRARNRTTGLEAAVRMLPLPLAQDPKVAERMESVIARLEPLVGVPGILLVDRYEVADRTPIFVHDPVEGETLQDRLRRDRRLPAEEVRRIAGAVAEALARAHGKHLHHGDLRSSSVVLAKSGEVLLTDFGVGKVVSDVSARALEGLAVGARGGFHRSPEIRRTELPTASSDLYALGCLVFEAATGQKHFPDRYRAACDDPRPGAPFPDPCAGQGEMDPGLRAAARKLLAPHPSDRFPDAGKAVAGLRGEAFVPAAILEDGAVAEPPAPAPAAPAPAAPPTPPPPPPPSRHAPPGPSRPPPKVKTRSPGVGGGVLVVVLLLLLLGGGAWWYLHPTKGPTAAVEDAGPPAKVLGPAPAAIPDLPPPPPQALKGRRLPDHVADRDGRFYSLLDGAELVLVPEGSSTLGAEDGAADEGPVRRLVLSAFLVDRHEVTVGQYRRFCEATGRRLPPQPSGGSDRHPVVNVSWPEADAFARWARRRLPTEAEWEKAVRGAFGNPFPWGASINPSLFNGPGDEDGQPTLAPCGSFPGGASPFGVLDGLGNVWEWCSDWYAADAYRRAAERDPSGPTSGTDRVVRGGSCLLGPPMRTSFRNRAAPGVRFEDLGFRCAVALPK